MSHCCNYWKCNQYCCLSGATGPKGLQGSTGPPGVGFQGATGPGGSVGGANTEVLFNDAGVANGDPNFIWDKTNKTLSFVGAINQPSILIGASDASGSVGVRSSTGTTSYGLVLPSGQGLANTILQNDGSGNLSWGNKSTENPGGVNTNIQYNDAGIFGGDANFAWDKVNQTIFVSGAINQPSVLIGASDASGSVGVRSSTGTTSYNLVLPSGQGLANTILQNDGSGNLSWGNKSTENPGGANTNIQYNDSGSFGGDANLIWNKTSFKMGIDGGITQSNSVAPSSLGNIFGPGLVGAFSIFVLGNYAYAVTATPGDNLVIIDITDPLNPLNVSTTSLSLLTSPSDIFVQGDYAYITGGGLRIVNVSNIAAPVQVGYVTSAALASSVGLYICGDYAYICCDTNRSFVIVDVYFPTLPIVDDTLTDAVNFEGIRNVVVQGRYAYTTVAAGPTAGIWILDVNNVFNIVAVGNVTFAGGGRDLQFTGRYIFATTGTGNSVVSIDASDPSAPVLTDTLAGITGSYAIALSNNYLYAADNVGAVHVVNISNPVTMTLETSFAVILDRMTISGNVLCGVNASFGLFLTIDINGTSLTSLTSGCLKANTVDVLDRLQVLGSATFKSGMQVNNSVNILSRLSVNGNLDVQGTIYNQGNIIAQPLIPFSFQVNGGLASVNKLQWMGVNLLSLSYIIPVNGIIRYITVVLDTSDTATFTVQVNAVNTALTLGIVAAQSGMSSGTISVNAGDRLDIELSAGSITASAIALIYVAPS